MSTNTIDYPYMPEDGAIEYVPKTDPYLQAAKEFARHESLDAVMPNASVIVKNGEILGWGANGSNYHDNNPCKRIELGSKTGEDYDKCEGCHPKNHSEPTAIRDALQHGRDVNGAELYLWGHWWCCQPCWDAMLEVGITTVKLLEKSEVLFNKAAEGNIIGSQFESDKA